MAIIKTDSQNYTNIANAIRSQNGTTNSYTPAEMGQAIMSLSTVSNMEGLQEQVNTHIADSTIHVTSTEKQNYSTAYNHSQSTHAPSDAEKNQNAFSTVKVGDVEIEADTTTDTVSFVAGSNITLTSNATDKNITINAVVDTSGVSGVLDSHTTNKDNPHEVTLSQLGVNATADEINYLDGVTSNVQTQIDSKLPLAGGAVTGDLTVDGVLNSNQLYRPNLLVNGDFQINQRGQSSYSGIGYGLDMWTWFNNNATVTINSDGTITLSTNAARYYNQILRGLKSGYYTAVIKVLNCSGTIMMGLDNMSDIGIGSIYLSNGINKITVNGDIGKLWVMCNGSVTIEYIDLFEGTVAYPHVKEDYATALMRCREYYRIEWLVGTLSYDYRETNGRYVFNIALPTMYAKEPTMVASKAYMYIDNTYSEMNIETIYKRLSAGNATNTPAYVILSGHTIREDEYSCVVLVQLSCEPL